MELTAAGFAGYGMGRNKTELTNISHHGTLSLSKLRKIGSPILATTNQIHLMPVSVDIYIASLALTQKDRIMQIFPQPRGGMVYTCMYWRLRICIGI